MLRTCDLCDRTTDAGEWPDWVNGRCDICDPAVYCDQSNQFHGSPCPNPNCDRRLHLEEDQIGQPGEETALHAAYECGGQSAVFAHVEKFHRDWQWRYCVPCESWSPEWRSDDGALCAVCWTVFGA